jgi:hypothetical protein
LAEQTKTDAEDQAEAEGNGKARTSKIEEGLSSLREQMEESQAAAKKQLEALQKQQEMLSNMKSPKDLSAISSTSADASALSEVSVGANTALTEMAMPGAFRIQVKSEQGFKIGLPVMVGDETNGIAGLSPLSLGMPLTKEHGLGTSVRAIGNHHELLQTDEEGSHELHHHYQKVHTGRGSEHNKKLKSHALQEQRSTDGRELEAESSAEHRHGHQHRGGHQQQTQHTQTHHQQTHQHETQHRHRGHQRQTHQHGGSHGDKLTHRSTQISSAFEDEKN